MTAIEGTLKMYVGEDASPNPMDFIEFMFYEVEYRLLQRGWTQKAQIGPKGELDLSHAIRVVVSEFHPYAIDYLEVPIQKGNLIDLINLCISAVLQPHPRNENNSQKILAMAYNDHPLTTQADVLKIVAMAREYYLAKFLPKIEAKLAENNTNSSDHVVHKVAAD